MARLKTDPNALFLGLMDKTQDAPKPKIEEDRQDKQEKREKPIDPAELEGMDPEDMTLPQLKAYAKQEGVKLGGARTKPAILSLLKEGNQEGEDEAMVLISAKIPESMKKDLDTLVYKRKMAGEKTGITQIIRESLEAELRREKIR